MRDSHSNVILLWKVYKSIFSIKVWTEERDRRGAKNFLTGLGGFLQAVLHGYGGLRICTPQNAQDQMVPGLYINPTASVPTLSNQDDAKTTLNISGIAFLGRRIDLSLDSAGSVLKVTLVSGQPMTLVPTSSMDTVQDPASTTSWKLKCGDGALGVPYAAYWLIE